MGAVYLVALPLPRKSTLNIERTTVYCDLAAAAARDGA